MRSMRTIVSVGIRQARCAPIRHRLVPIMLAASLAVCAGCEGSSADEPETAPVDLGTPIVDAEPVGDAAGLDARVVDLGEGATDAASRLPEMAVPPMDQGAVDAGPADAWSMDAGAVTDAALGDAGGDAGEAPLTPRAWFRDYNQGHDQAYLNRTGVMHPDGDARYPDAPGHTYRADVSYGPLERNVLDFWAVEGDAAAPVAVYIHGGGFRNGDKEGVHNGRSIPRLLQAGISVASISYRYAANTPELALAAEAPNAEGSDNTRNGARLDYVLRDCARAIQYLRYRAAEWGIDPARIGAWGGSAGAGCAVWTGTIPDLAVRGHADPVLRESTRLAVMGHGGSQPTYNFRRWPALLQMDPEFVYDIVGGEAVRLTQLPLDEVLNAPHAEPLNRILDFYALLGRGDPPLYTTSPREDLSEADMPDWGAMVHHPRGHVALYRRCQAVGLTCEIDTRIESSGYQGDIIDFLIEHLQP